MASQNDRILLAYATDRSVVTESDAKRLTHLNLAFAKIDAKGGFTLNHPLEAQFDTLRAWNPSLRILASVIPLDPEAFTKCAAEPELRKTMARNCAEFLNARKLDGIDFDWEYPCVPSNGMAAGPNDKVNFTAFLSDVRDAIGSKLLTIAAGADLYFCESVEVARISEILDFINVMTYDLKCGFHTLAGHHTALYSSTGDYFRNSCDQAMRLFEAYGAPKDKLVMGAAFYSRKWEGIKDINHGFLQYSKTGGGYGRGFTNLTKDYINKNGYVRYWDDEAKAPYLYNADSQTFISYDDETSIAHKCRYVLDHGYRGLFYWEHGSDQSGALLTAAYNGLSQPDAQAAIEVNRSI
jgi:chitinase